MDWHPAPNPERPMKHRRGSSPPERQPETVILIPREGQEEIPPPLENNFWAALVAIGGTFAALLCICWFTPEPLRNFFAQLFNFRH